MRSIIIRYSEIAIKSRKVRIRFENLLAKNIEHALLQHDITNFIIEKIPGRFIVKVDDHDYDKVVKILPRIFGVKSISPCFETTFKELQELTQYAEKLWGNKIVNKTFAVRARRVGIHNFTSIDVERSIGSALLRYSRGVNLEKPDITLHIEIRNHKAYFYDEVIEGPGGLPLGSQGKALALISGGIDSPVAAWLVMRRGVLVDALFCNLAGELELIPVLRVIYTLFSSWSLGYDAKVYVINGEELINEIRLKVNPHLWNLIFKRVLYLIGEEIAKKIKAKALITGEVIGQVSSQTLHNIYATEYGISIPIIRPLAGLDKDEIMKIAQKIGTYNYSIEVEEYCAIFSSKPKTRAKPEEVEREFEKIDKKLIDGIVSNVRIYKVSELEDLLRGEDKDLEIDYLPSNAIIIDLRSEDKYRSWHIPGAINIKPEDIEKIIDKYGKDKTYILYCSGTLLSKYLVRKLRRLGINAYSLNLRKLKI